MAPQGHVTKELKLGEVFGEAKGHFCLEQIHGNYARKLKELDLCLSINPTVTADLDVVGKWGRTILQRTVTGCVSGLTREAQWTWDFVASAVGRRTSWRGFQVVDDKGGAVLDQHWDLRRAALPLDGDTTVDFGNSFFHCWQDA